MVIYFFFFPKSFFRPLTFIALSSLGALPDLWPFLRPCMRASLAIPLDPLWRRPPTERL